MITIGQQKIDKIEDLNNQFLELKGEINDNLAKSTLARFLIHNPGVTWELLTGNKLFEFQEILLRGWLAKNFNLSVISRGGSKTYLASIFCCLYPIFNPNTQIVIASSGFRRSRAILEQVDVFLKSDGSQLLRQCYPVPMKRRNDEYRLGFGDGGYIVAIPLNENCRGFRAGTLICDEGILISEEMFRAILMPFIVAHSGIKEKLQIKEIEDYLVDRGLLEEKNRDIVKSMKKIIMLSSASYKFQFLYNLYEEWIGKIIKGIEKDESVAGNYFVSRLSFEALPKELIDMTVINEAKSGGMSESTFAREFSAMFTDDSSGFFSMKKMAECTIPSGHEPCLELKGDSSSKYILSLDSNLSESKSADHHGMSVFKLDYINKTILCVHNYARAGCGFKEHALYFFYLLTHFNIIAIITDKTGGGIRFIQSCNEMSLFKNNKIKINIWDADFDSDDYLKAISDAKRTYNLGDKQICYGQNFTSESIGKMADNLQIYIDRKRILFASLLASRPSILFDVEGTIPSYLYEGENNPNKSIIDFIDEQDDNIELMKSETALIEVKVTPLGVRTFTLPIHLKRSESINRARRDLFSCLQMGTWLAKCLWDMTDLKEEDASLTPTFIG